MNGRVLVDSVKGYLLGMIKVVIIGVPYVLLGGCLTTYDERGALCMTHVMMT